MKQFEKEMVSRSGWKQIRVTLSKPNGLIANIGEFTTNGPQYQNVFVAKGKKLAAYVKNWFIISNFPDNQVTFDEIRR